MVLGIVSRITSGLCGGGLLLHESYMTFWASFTTVMLGPVFFGAYIFYNKKEVNTSLSFEQTLQLVEMISALFFLVLFKAFYLERDIMRRFVEDYNEEIHAINAESEQEDVPRRVHLTIENDDSELELPGRSTKIVQTNHETDSQRLERRYNEHEAKQKRNNINLSVLMVPLVLFIYLTFRETGLSLRMK